MVEIKGYKARAVTIFWDLIKGFNELLTACQDYTILADMLIFADFYDINRLNDAINHQIDNVKVGKENLIQGMAAVENLEKLDRYENIASNLEKRCIAFTESTFRSAKDVGLLVSKNSNNIDLVIRLLDKCLEMKTEEIKVNKECFHCKKNLQVKCNALPLGTNLLCNICSGYEYKKYCKCNINRKCEASYCYTSTSVKSRCCNTSTCHTCQGHEARRYCQPH